MFRHAGYLPASPAKIYVSSHARKIHFDLPDAGTLLPSWVGLGNVPVHVAAQMRYRIRIVRVAVSPPVSTGARGTF